MEDVAEVPEGAPLMLSAHGSPPAVVEAARARGGAVVNAVCPLVKKVHHEVKVRAGKGYTIVYVGHEGHQEAIGTAAVAPEAVQRVERLDGAAALPDPDGPVAFLAQTTLAVDEWEALLGAARDRWPDLWVPGTRTCASPPPTGRPALKTIARGATPWSSSAPPTRPTPWPSSAPPRPPAARGCCGSTRRLSCPMTWPACVGVIAGASAPEELVQAVVARLAPSAGVEEVRAVEEDQYFPLPRELRDAVRNLAAAAAVAGLAPGGDPTAGGAPPGRPDLPLRWRWPVDPLAGGWDAVTASAAR